MARSLSAVPQSFTADRLDAIERELQGVRLLVVLRSKFLLTIADTAELLSMSEREVYRLFDRGELHPMHRGERPVFAGITRRGSVPRHPRPGRRPAYGSCPEAEPPNRCQLSLLEEVS